MLVQLRAAKEARLANLVVARAICNINSRHSAKSGRWLPADYRLAACNCEHICICIRVGVGVVVVVVAFTTQLLCDGTVTNDPCKWNDFIMIIFYANCNLNLSDLGAPEHNPIIGAMVDGQTETKNQSDSVQPPHFVPRFSSILQATNRQLHTFTGFITETIIITYSFDRFFPQLFS